MLSDDLKQLFKETPGIILAGEALEDLVEDVQAVFIKNLPALGLNQPTETSNPFTERPDIVAQVEDVENSVFGVTLFNLFTLTPVVGRYYFTARRRIVRAMLYAMFLASRMECRRQADESIR